ncbi:MAG: carboxypeptidase-like regulatory domain-containing protein, partial [Rufibacter sp.]
MRFLFLLLFLCHFQFTSSAQPLGNIISGRVQDVSQKPVAYATVVLQSAADSSVVQGAMTNDLGEFAFQNVKADSYFISAQFLGYEKALSPRVQVLEGGGAVHTLPALTLQNSTTALGEVVVQAQKPLVEVHPDKLVLHVSASALTNGGSALEALEKAPGVVVAALDVVYRR